MGYVALHERPDSHYFLLSWCTGPSSSITFIFLFFYFAEVGSPGLEKLFDLGRGAALKSLAASAQRASLALGLHQSLLRLSYKAGLALM